MPILVPGWCNVQFHAMWSEHCKSYKSGYIDLATEINLRYALPMINKESHSVPYPTASSIGCQQNNIKRYPTIVAFRGNLRKQKQ